jgi:hypothetical protein
LLSRQQLLENTGIVDFTSKLLFEDLRIILNTSPIRSQRFPLLHQHPFQASAIMALNLEKQLQFVRALSIKLMFISRYTNTLQYGAYHHNPVCLPVRAAMLMR